MIESRMGCEMIVSVCTHVANEMIESTVCSGCEMIVSVCAHVANEMIESAACSGCHILVEKENEQLHVTLKNGEWHSTMKQRCSPLIRQKLRPQIGYPYCS